MESDRTHMEKKTGTTSHDIAPGRRARLNGPEPAIGDRRSTDRRGHRVSHDSVHKERVKKDEHDVRRYGSRPTFAKSRSNARNENADARRRSINLQNGARGHSEMSARNNTPSSGMKSSEIMVLLQKDPNSIVMTLAAPRSGFEQALHNSHIVEEVYEIVAKACDSSGKISSLNRILQMLNTSGFFVRSTIEYLTKCIMAVSTSRKVPNPGTLIALCKTLQNVLERIPAFSTDNVTAVIAQLKVLVSMMPNDDRKQLLNESIKNIDEQQMDVIKQIQGGRILKETDDDDGNLEPPDNFRQISIVPSQHDLQDGFEPFIRKNKVVGSYKTVDQYLDTQFRLLREDYIMPLRQGIRELKRAGNKPIDDKYLQDVRVYKDVFCEGCWYHNKGVVYRICFGTSKLGRIRWETSRRLIYGSLVCLSADNFTTFVIGTVAERDPQLLKQGRIDIFLHDKQRIDLNPFTNFQMVESSAYFEAYRHNLLGIQEFTENGLPFKAYLLNDSSSSLNSAPRYLQGNDVQFDFAPVLLKYTVKTKCRLLDEREWPKASQLGLDMSQYSALRLALTREFAIIQGPPGTGKTFIGLKIVQLLLHNFDVWGHGRRLNEGLINCPILLVCYTNHALDQFLDGILQYADTRDIVRVGGRCQSENERVQQCVLPKWKQSREIKMSIPQELHEQRVATREQMKDLEKWLTDMGELTNTRTKILDTATLLPVMNQYHRQSFEILGANRKDSIKTWLFSKPHPLIQSQFGLQPLEHWDGGTSDQHDQFDCEEEVNETAAFQSSVCEEEIRQIEQHRLIDDFDDEKDERIGTVSKKKLDASYYKDEKFREPNAWETVQHKKEKSTDCRELNRNECMTESEEATCTDIWQLPSENRWNLYRLWRGRFFQEILFRMKAGQDEFDQLAKRLDEIRDEEDYHVLKRAKVIAMTTTCAAKFRHVLGRIQPRIVIVEEAAEVLEAHIVTSLSEGCQHLILIGDHQQLRPNPTVYKLAKKYHLDVSLFERMLRNRVHCECLEIQHRMRPEIVRLIVPHIYKQLQNHESVKLYDNVRGVHGNMLFLHHEHKEDSTFDTRSRTNAYEADYLIALCRYLIMQGYEESQVTILTTYTGQMFEIRKKSKLDQLISDVRVTPVDNFQGEENDIILLSLVRSNEEGNIGFLKIANRICVALSRAKKGFYVMGDMQMMKESSSIWRGILKDLESEHNVVNGIPLYCQNHPETGICAVTVDDFKKAPRGGCTMPCEIRLKCGHVCEMLCHPADPGHVKYQCQKPCSRTTCPLRHPCPKRCYEECGACEILVEKTSPKCPSQHKLQVKCHINETQLSCTAPCENKMGCGHSCPEPCGKICRGSDTCTVIVKGRMWPCGHELNVECHKNATNYPCPVEVEKDLSCGHTAKMKCCDDEQKYRCMQPVHVIMCQRECVNNVTCFLSDQIRAQGCQVNIDKTCEHNDKHLYKAKCCDYDVSICSHRCGKTMSCGHACQGLCGKCMSTGKHQRCPMVCQRILPCKHECRGKCGEPCMPCRGTCIKRCPHMSCRNECGFKCLECREPCMWNCPHRQCNRLCSEDCRREPCDFPCQRRLPCRHQCAGYCGEPCPPACFKCNRDIYDHMRRSLGIGMEDTSRYVLLHPCCHVVTRKYMDARVQTHTHERTQHFREFHPFQCPLCNTQVQHCPRYHNSVLLNQNDMDSVKKSIYEGSDVRRTLSHFAVGIQVSQECSDDLSNITEIKAKYPHFRYIIGCLSLMYQAGTILEKIGRAKNKSADGTEVSRLQKSNNSFEGEMIALIAINGEEEQTKGFEELTLKIQLFYMKCILYHMLTYVRSYNICKDIKEILFNLDSKDNSKRLLRLVNRLVLDKVPIGLRNGITDYLEEMNKYHQKHVDFLLEKKWILCDKGHAFAVAPGVDVTSVERCPSCQTLHEMLEDDQPGDIDDIGNGFAIRNRLHAIERFRLGGLNRYLDDGMRDLEDLDFELGLYDSD